MSLQEQNRRCRRGERVWWEEGEGGGGSYIVKGLMLWQGLSAVRLKAVVMVH